MSMLGYIDAHGRGLSAGVVEVEPFPIEAGSTGISEGSR
jgi:hypothetical protein